jgi:hypothetical protein
MCLNCCLHPCFAGSFLLDLRSGRLGLALMATRMTVNTQVTEGRVLATLTFLGDPEVIKAYGLSPQDVSVSVKMMEGLEEKVTPCVHMCRVFDVIECSSSPILPPCAATECSTAGCLHVHGVHAEQAGG